MRKTRVLVVCVEKIASVTVGVLEPLKCLEGKGLIEVRFCRTLDVGMKEIQWCDVLVCVRGFEAADLNIVNTMKKLGRKVIYFLDDDFQGIPKNVPSGAYLRRESIQDNMVKIMEKSDALWAVNPLIVQKYGKYFPHAAVCSCLSEPGKQRLTSEEIRIGYAGSTDHKAYIEELLRTPVCNIIEKYGKKVKFYFFGACPDFGTNPQIEYVEFIDGYLNYKNKVSEIGYMIGLAPIPDEPFYKHKYFNKFLEYTSIGAVGIYTNTPPYTFIVEDGENGILCGNSPSEWQAAMERLIEGDKFRQELFECSAAIVRERFNSTKISENIQESFPELMTFRAKKIYSTVLKMFKLKNTFHFYFFRLKGLFQEKGLFAVVHIVRKLAEKLLSRIRGAD